MISGATSAAITTILTNAVHDRPWYENLLQNVGKAAAMAAIKYDVQHDRAVTQAAAERAARQEAMDRLGVSGEEMMRMRAEMTAAYAAANDSSDATTLMMEARQASPWPGYMADAGDGMKTMFDLIGISADKMDIVVILARYYDKAVPDLTIFSHISRIGSAYSIGDAIYHHQFPLSGLTALGFAELAEGVEGWRGAAITALGSGLSLVVPNPDLSTPWLLLDKTKGMFDNSPAVYNACARVPFCGASLGDWARELH